jgi:hypothetical protein
MLLHLSCAARSSHVRVTFRYVDVGLTNAGHLMLFAIGLALTADSVHFLF